MLYDGRVAFNPEAETWRGLLNEMRAFPDGRHDDQIDSISQFLKWVRGPRGRSFVSANGEGSAMRDEFGRCFFFQLNLPFCFSVFYSFS